MTCHQQRHECIIFGETPPLKHSLTILLTQRLRIEPLQAAHAPLVLQPLQDLRLYNHIPQTPPSAEALQRRYDFLSKGASPDGREKWLNWVAFGLHTDAAIGTFQATLPRGAPGSIAYMVFTPFWRQGYAAEMATRVIDHLFAVHQPPSLYAEIDTRNTASIALVQSLGLARVATTIAADHFNGEQSDEYTHSISREDWRRRRAIGNPSLP